MSTEEKTRISKRAVPALVVLVVGVVAVACGSDGTGSSTTATSTTTTPATTTATTMAPPSTASAETTMVETTVAGDTGGAEAGGEFCERLVAIQAEAQTRELDITDPAAVEESVRGDFEALQDLRGSAPDEISADYEAFVEFSQSVLDLYEEYDFDILAIPEDELTAIGQADPLAPVLDYCDVDEIVADAPEGDGDDGSDGTDGSDGDGGGGDVEIPSSDVVPEEVLAPPGVTQITPAGDRYSILSDAPYDEMVDYYRGLAGLEEAGEETNSSGQRQMRFLDGSTSPPGFEVLVQDLFTRTSVIVQPPG